MDLYDRLGINLKPSHLSATEAASFSFLDANSVLLENLRQSIGGYHDLEALIPQTESKLFSGHSFPYYESYRDLEVSVHLAMMGFYKPAFISLRSCLELGLLCVYYDRNDDSETVITEWLHSNDRTPMKRKIISDLSKIDNVSSLCFQLPLLESVSKLYDQLSNFVHTRGVPFSTESLSQSNVNLFSERSLKGLLDAACITIQDLVILFLCKYPIGMFELPLWEKFGLNPPFGGFLEPMQVDNLKRIIGPQVLSVLEPICHADPSAKNVASQIEGLPDLTEGQLENQAIEVDQEGIRRNGYVSWYEHNGKAMSSSDPELGQYFKDRLSKLEAWARANNLYENGVDSKNHSAKDEP